MAATAETLYFHGTSPGTPGADVIGSTVRYKREDNDTQDNVDPLPKPAAGENLTWTKWSKMNWTTPPAGDITNLRYFTAAPGANIKHYARVETPYLEPVVGDEGGITGFTDNQTNKDLFDEDVHTSASPLVVNAGTVLSNPSIGLGTQNFVQSQLGVLAAFAGGPGAITAFDLTYRYSET